MLSILYGLLFFLVLCRNHLMVLVGTVWLLLLSLGSLSSTFSCSLDTSFYHHSISITLIMLTLLITALALITLVSPDQDSSISRSLLVLLALSLTVAFMSTHLLVFYISFEASLFPIVMLLVLAGSQPERLQAGLYLVLYTVGASLPFLVLLLFHRDQNLSWDILMSNPAVMKVGSIGLILAAMVFLVKLPMYGVHLWLPKAHVEAPLVGSMLLAGILLKLGGYGLFLVSIVFDVQSSNMLFFILCNSLWGGFLASLGALKQVDIKAFVAYSSVTHMGVVVAGGLLNTTWSVNAAFITMIAHGITSSAMFFMAAFTSHLSHTRSLPYISGLIKVFPLLSLWWFLMCSVNMACPPSMNFMGELLLVPGLSQVGTGLLVAFAVTIFMGAVYNFYLYSALNHGKLTPYMLAVSNLPTSFYLSVLAHALPMFMILALPVCV